MEYLLVFGNIPKRSYQPLLDHFAKHHRPLRVDQVGDAVLRIFSRKSAIAAGAVSKDIIAKILGINQDQVVAVVIDAKCYWSYIGQVADQCACLIRNSFGYCEAAHTFSLTSTPNEVIGGCPSRILVDSGTYRELRTGERIHLK